MKERLIYEYLERIANLLRSDARKTEAGQQPVQLEALFYLSVCNRYSNTPVAVAEYLGLTKGTVSQTLRILEQNELIKKQPDSKDRRVVHLQLTERGTAVLASSVPPPTLAAAVARLSDSEVEAAEAALANILNAMQRANRLKTFGVCRTCRYNMPGEGSMRFCGLTKESLSPEDSQRICREHDLSAA